MFERFKRFIHQNRITAIKLVSFVVAMHGLYVLAVTLLDQIATHHGSRLTSIVVDVPLLIGISLIYLSSLLRRQKKTAWQVTVVAYIFYLGLGFTALLNSFQDHNLTAIEVIRRLILPVSVLALLYVLRSEFVVQSDNQSFRSSLKFSIVVLSVAFLYGIAGFSLLDKSDYHQEIRFPSAVHYTIDQFDLTTVHPLHPYTKRAHLFADSLSFVSVAALVYVAIALFKPLKMRLYDQTNDRDKVLEILKTYGAPSEEFFKVWPHDKQYFIDETKSAAIAYHVYRGVALCLSDPVGDAKRFDKLMSDFRAMCFSNDWLPALVHVGDTYAKLYDKNSFALQKLGQEAILHLDHFAEEVAGTKYFRQINNKFTKQGYSAELLTPPHHAAVISRLKSISDDWLGQGSRAERGFVMGYFTEEYMQQCQIMVARDAAGTIQAFTNLVPADFDKEEATYDMLRQSSKSLGNVNDYLLMELITELRKRNYLRLNLGLCPLVGLEQIDKDKRTLIDRVLKFAYANGDRFYSFNGLHRFKNKYQPVWHDKYLGYQGGIRGFSRTISAVIRAMKVKV